MARARNAVAVSGTAAQIGSAFKTEIHIYKVDGETHYANSTEPSLPAAMQGVVQGIHGLHDFRLKARSRKPTMLGVPADGVSPNYNSSGTGNHYLAPDDFATIFDIQSLYNAGINGSGQKIVIVGQSAIVPRTWRLFAVTLACRPRTSLRSWFQILRTRGPFRETRKNPISTCNGPPRWPAAPAWFSCTPTMLPTRSNMP